jgi:ribosomal protein L21
VEQHPLVEVGVVQMEVSREEMAVPVEQQEEATQIRVVAYQVKVMMVETQTVDLMAPVVEEVKVLLVAVEAVAHAQVMVV